MTSDELQTFTTLLSAYKKLLIDHQTLIFVRDQRAMGRPVDADEAKEKFLELVSVVFEPIEIALVEGKPLLGVVQAALKSS